jgi:hypothetical protein
MSEEETFNKLKKMPYEETRTVFNRPTNILDRISALNGTGWTYDEIVEEALKRLGWND